jgi:hypothetical protein
VRLRAISVLLLGAVLTWAAPLLGLALTGRLVSDYLGFPPRTQFVPHEPFDGRVFAALSLPLIGAAALYWIAIAGGGTAAPAPPQRRFPWWGWIGLSLLAASWFLAWHESAVPAAWRRQIFAPLWLGYILSVNGHTVRRTGASLLTRSTSRFAALFAVSAVFWWLFEHLNRFVHNWYYTGIDAPGDWQYVAQATLPFATVLPAVASTWAWLRSFPRLDALRLPAIRGRASLAWYALAAGLIALAGIGIWPERLFAVLWLGPLLVLAGLQQLVLGETIFSPLARGDWRPILQPALAALVCGLLWELWNSGGLAKWHYSIPYVQRFPLFEMPLLGYAGYLPFGVECALVIDLVARSVRGRAIWPPERRPDRQRASPAM